jgi:hypothetical protein
VKAPTGLKYDNPLLPPVASALKDESKEDSIVSIDECHQNELDDVRIEELDYTLTQPSIRYIDSRTARS